MSNLFHHLLQRIIENKTIGEEVGVVVTIIAINQFRHLLKRVLGNATIIEGEPLATLISFSHRLLKGVHGQARMVVPRIPDTLVPCRRKIHPKGLAKRKKGVHIEMKMIKIMETTRTLIIHIMRRKLLVTY
jgi:hypothetical protein